MSVVGQYAYIISDTVQIADVNPFIPDHQSVQIPIVGNAIQYDCPYSGVSYILVIRNTLHVTLMRNNLLPPFILREAVVTKDTDVRYYHGPPLDILH